jgi:hypothetical protein
VPLVHGEFGVRWKIKNVHNSGSKNILEIVKGRSKGKDKETNGKGREESEEEEREGERNPYPGADGVTEDGISIPSVIVSGQSHSKFSTFSNTSFTTTSSSSASTSRPATSLSSHMPYADYLTADWLPSSLFAPTVAVDETPSLSSTPPEAYSPARGRTEFIKLKDHSVTWEHIVDVVVKMDVERDTLDLLPNNAKLIVMQRVIPGDPDAPHNPRLGVLYLNLAEYANAGSVTRRYLLRESKTNANLKVCDTSPSLFS